MYGMIHKAMRDLIQDSFGDDAWERVQARAGVDEEDFLSLRNYDDQIAYTIVSASAEELNQDAAELLRSFGEHWILKTAAEHYDKMIQSYGGNTWEVLNNLNLMHARIRSTFSTYKPPTFEVEEGSSEPDQLVLHYKSTRHGLTSFVEGLIQGLAALYNETIEIVSIEQLACDSGEHTVFELRRS